MSSHLHIFTDGSVNTGSKIGYGAYLVVSDLGVSVDSLKNEVKVKRFEQTSSTKLELQTLLWALSELNASTNSLTAYTDSQNIIGLPARQASLEQNSYLSNKGKRLNNYELYQEFYQLTAKMSCRFVKVKGHQPSGQKGKIDRLFGLVDQASRRILRST